MKQTKLFRRSVAVISALTVGISAVVLVKADTKQKKKLLIMGDSISAGYGLGENEKGYYDLVAECLDAELTNIAVSGYETKDVLAQLATEEVQAAIKDADIICMSIGSNDLLHPTIEYAESLKESEDEDLPSVLNRLKDSGSIEEITAALTRKLRTPIREAQANLPEIEKQVRALNEDAQFIMYTLYNPFETTHSLSYEGEDYSDSYSLFMDYVNGQEARISAVIMELKTVTTVDISAKFKGHGFVYLRDEINDIHPNPVGHAMFAAATLAVIDGDKKQSSGFVQALASMPTTDRPLLPAIDKRLLLTFGDTFGDLDNNGKRETADADAMLKYLTEQKNKDGVTVYDVDGDGFIDISDVTALLALRD